MKNKKQSLGKIESITRIELRFSTQLPEDKWKKGEIITLVGN